MQDFRSPFDVVDHNGPRRLGRSRAPDMMLELVRILTTVRVKSSVFVNKCQGFLEASPLSPILFNVFMDR